MRIVVPKVVVPVDMGEYAAPLAGKQLHVWVNPPMRVIDRYWNAAAPEQAAYLQATREARAVDAPKASGFTRMVLQLVEGVASVQRKRKSARLDGRLLGWYAEIWSQGPQDTGWTVRELRTLE